MAYVLFFCCKLILKEKKDGKNGKKIKKEREREKKQFASSSTAVSFSCPGCSWCSSQQVYYCNLNKDNRTYEIKKSPIDKLLGCVGVIYLAWTPRKGPTLKYTGNYHFWIVGPSHLFFRSFALLEGKLCILQWINAHQQESYTVHENQELC